MRRVIFIILILLITVVVYGQQVVQTVEHRGMWYTLWIEEQGSTEWFPDWDYYEMKKPTQILRELIQYYVLDKYDVKNTYFVVLIKSSYDNQRWWIMIDHPNIEYYMIVEGRLERKRGGNNK